MSETNTSLSTLDLLNDASTEAEYQALQRWEAWFLGLRAHLHWCVNEEHGGATALEEFFDVYGLAMEAAAGNPCIADFFDVMPPVPTKSYPNFPVPALMDRVFAEVHELPKDNLTQVASALREKAAAFVRLAEQIDAGEFVFPKW